MQKDWKGTTYGNTWMHKTLMHILRHIDLRIMYCFAAIFVLPVCMIVNPGRRHIYHYFRNRFNYSPLKSILLTYRNFYMFMQVVIDKFAMYAGKRFKIEITGNQHYLNLLNQPSAFIQLTSHVGNPEIAGYSLNPHPKHMSVLVYAGEKSDVMEHRRRIFQAMGLSTISVGNGTDHIFQISNAIQRGEILSMPADRILGSTKSVTVSLLGKDANLPMGPFAVAAANDLPVVLISVLKTHHNTYHIHVTPLPYDRHQARPVKIQQLADNYASQLQNILTQYPTQWYNYFDFWQDLTTPETVQRTWNFWNPLNNWNPRNLHIQALLPQSAPYLMVSQLQHIDPKTTVSTLHITNDNFFVHNGHFQTVGLLETIAQTCALRQGYISRYIRHQPHIQAGVIGAVSNLTIHSQPHVGETVTTQVTITAQFGNYLMAHAHVTANTDNRQLMSTDIKIALRS